MNWNDFNTAEDQTTFDLIPKGTLVKVRMNLKPGGYNDPERGWTEGYATRNATSGAVYLNGECVVLEGLYLRRKIWILIGLHSEKGDQWAIMGRSLIKSILNSARGVSRKDNSSEAQKARCIQGFSDLDGIEFVARVDVETDHNGNEKNVIKQAISCDHKEYVTLMRRGGSMSFPAHNQSMEDPLPAWAL